MLEAFQAAMAQALLGRSPPPDGIVGDRIPAAARFGIHANTVVGSLALALEAAFPATHRLIGPDRFRAAATAFAREHPPRVPQLLAYGDGFPDFLLDFDGDALAGELARFEWARQMAYFAEDAPALDLDSLRAVAPECYPDLRFRLHPSAHPVATRFPVLALWTACRSDDPADTDKAPCAPAPAGEPRHLLVIRPHGAVHAVPVSPGDFTLLLALSAGTTLGEAADAAAALEPDIDLQAALLAHLRLGTFTAFR